MSAPTAVPPPARGIADRRLLHLDVIRGVAILLVLGQHSPTDVRIHPAVDAASNYLHKNGYLGVDLFFVLSGFLIGGLLFRELDRTGTLRVRRFLARRAFKIWPAYLICLTACCLAAGWAGRDAAGNPGTTGEMFADMWPAYLHVQNYVPSTARFVWFWSLGVEEHFYLLLPATLLLLGIGRGWADRRRLMRRVAWLGLAVAVSCLALRGLAKALHPAPDGYAHAFPTHLRADALMAGVVLAAFARFAPEVLLPVRPWRWLLAAVGVGVFLLPAVLPDQKFDHLYPFDGTLTTLGAACVVLVAYFADLPPANARMHRPRASYFAWPAQAISLVGVFSYSIYLWHGYFAPPVSRRMMDAAGLAIGGTGPATLVHVAAYLAAAIVLGVLGSWVIERPFLALRDRAFPTRTVVAQPAAAHRPVPAAVV